MGELSEHSLLSASGAVKWVPCNGSLALESVEPNSSSTFANEGTAAHGLAAYLLSGVVNKEITKALLMNLPGEMSSGRAASDFIGETIIAEGQAFVVDQDFADHVQAYVDYVLSEAQDGALQVESRVNYASFLGVPEDMAWGTSDVIIVKETELVVIDLKFGKGVQVYAAGNPQAKLYALGAYNEVEGYADIKTVRWVIAQPRIGHDGWYDEDSCTIDELKMWGKTTAAMAAQHALKMHADLHRAAAAGEPYTVPVSELNPGDKQCRFCRAKASCPALTEFVVKSVAGDFVDLDAADRKSLPKLASSAGVSHLSHVELAEKMRAAPLIEAWLKDVRAKVESLLLASETVPGYKLVRGKKGNRQWANPAEAAKRLKRYLGAALAMQDPEPISPTAAEKLLLKSGQARAYSVLEKSFIKQSDGGISVAPDSDKREAYDPTPSVEAFSPIEEGDADDLSFLA